MGLQLPAINVCGIDTLLFGVLQSNCDCWLGDMKSFGQLFESTGLCQPRLRHFNGMVFRPALLHRNHKLVVPEPFGSQSIEPMRIRSKLIGGIRVIFFIEGRTRVTSGPTPRRSDINPGSFDLDQVVRANRVISEQVPNLCNRS